MSRAATLLVAAFPSELPRSSSLPRHVCGSRAGWRGQPPVLPPAELLLITGSCGALVPGVPPAALACPERLRASDGSWLDPDPATRADLLRAAAEAGLALEAGGLTEVETVMDREPARVELAERTGCRFVDMESATLARLAEAAGCRWAVLRFVTDGPERSLDWLAELYGGHPAEQPGVGRTLAALVARPRHLPRLLSLGLCVGKGRKAAGRVFEGLSG